MKLYFKPGACSLSPHIVLREAGLPFALEKVDGAGRTASGADFKAINPKGYVPALGLDDGNVLTEGAAIVQYLADLAPQTRLAPPAGSFERVRLQEWLHYIGTELHKGYSPLFNPKATDEQKQAQREAISKKLAWLDGQLTGPFLTGDTFTVADAYLFTVLNWSRFVGLDLAQWPNVAAFHARVGARPSVQAAIQAERGK